MGSPPKNGRTRLKNQAPIAQISSNGSTPVGGGKVSGAETLVIPLIKLDIVTVAKATVGQSILVKLESDYYQVYIDGQRLGTVPGSYNTALTPKAEHRGKIIEVNFSPSPRVVVEVRLTRTKP